MFRIGMRELNSSIIEGEHAVKWFIEYKQLR